jgi:type I restriction enzyme M protein
MNQQAIVAKLWNYCNVLRDDGLSYGDYVEQLTYMLFLKMADERTKPPFNQEPIVPAGLDWQSLLDADGVALEAQYLHLLNELGKQPGMLGVIFRKAQNRIQDPAKLKRLIVDLIDQEQWSEIGVDVKGDAYEGLLEKNAKDVKGDAGQYSTSRALLQAMLVREFNLTEHDLHIVSLAPSWSSAKLTRHRGRRARTMYQVRD